MRQFESLDDFLAEFASIAAGLKDRLAGKPGQFLLETKQGRRVVGRISEDGTVTLSDKAEGDVDCSISADETDLLRIINGTLSPMKAFITGKAKVKGSPLKLLELIKLL